MLDRRDTGKVGCTTGRMHKIAHQVGCRSGGMQYSNVRLQKSRDAGMEGCKKRGMHERRGTGKEGCR